MATIPLRPLLPPAVSRAIGWTLVYLLMVVGAFTFPYPPTPGLDPSWRMALGYFFEQRMQFGHDVVFTYGPLGFIMAKTFSGLQFWGLIAGQLVLAVISATVAFRQGHRLTGHTRLVFFLFFFLFAILYDDALHMIVLAILGFELLRLVDEPRRWRTIVIAAVLAGYSQIKFTDFLLAGFMVLIVLGYGLWRRRIAESVTLLISFVVVYLGVWMACGQNLANLPEYFIGSWEISQGYQWAMGSPTPTDAFWKGLVVLAVLALYGLLPLFLSRDKPRAWANSLILGAYVYLNWKHGFVRADGHMLGFFLCALLPLITYPVLLNDAEIFRFAHRRVFAVTILLCVLALESALPGTLQYSLSWMQDRLWRNITNVVDWKETRQRYRDQLKVARLGSDLSRTRQIVGEGTVDVLGCEQSVAIFNKFNYRPRPLIQSYSTFTPKLAGLNGDFLTSDRAPEFFLVRVETIDNRLVALDDAQILQLLPYRYEYVMTERGFQLWRRLPAPVDSASLKPKAVRNEVAKLNESLNLSEWSGTPLWVKIDVQPSLLGKLRSFLYKPPQVMLSIADGSGASRDYLMPVPQGRNGFILNPVIGDSVDYMYYASAKPRRWASAITVKVAENETLFFAHEAKVEISTLPPLASNGAGYFPKDIDGLFSMFRTPPIAYEAQTPFSAATIDGRQVAIMHAPSLMTFHFPEGAKYVSGMFGFMPETYTGAGRTNGARFTVYWFDGTNRKDLFQRFLNPLSVADDRGLQAFRVDLGGISGGLIYLEVNPGPYGDIGWDWTGWTDIYIAR